MTRTKIVELSVQELAADPHDIFRHYRPITPIIAHKGGGYLVLRLNDVEALTRSSSVRQSETEVPVMCGLTAGAVFDQFRYGILTSNGDVHRRRRSPLTRSFAAQMITAMRPGIRQTAEALIDGWEQDHEVDLVSRYTAEMPARLVSTLLGLPDEDIPHFTSLVYSVSRIFSLAYTRDQLWDIEDTARELTDYVETVLAERRQSPRDDFLSSLLYEATQKNDLSPIEIVMQIVSVIFAAVDTTRIAMAAQVSLLLQHRAQWEAVRTNPDLVRSAVAEAMRFEPSVASISRVTLETVTLDGIVVPPGQFLALSTMSAMRDETVYERPDEFDIHRRDQRRLHPIFGGGVHRCIGEALAWAELEEGLAALLTRLPGLRLTDGPLQLDGHVGIRRIGELRVAW